MKWLRDLFAKKRDEVPAKPRETNFFCLYCNAKFKNSDLERVIAHLKPHASQEEAELRLSKGIDAGR